VKSLLLWVMPMMLSESRCFDDLITRALAVTGWTGSEVHRTFSPGGRFLSSAPARRLDQDNNQGHEGCRN